MHKLIAFASEGFNGKGRTFEGPTSELPRSQDNIFSSVVVVSGEWELFPEQGFGGEAVRVSNTSGPSGDGVFSSLDSTLNDSISSLRPVMADAPNPHGCSGCDFDSLFPDQPPAEFEHSSLLSLGAAGGIMQDSVQDPTGDNSDIPAVFTYFGQFIDHDVTFEPHSRLGRHADTHALLNGRTPALDLDNVYSGGPEDEPYLYERRGFAQVGPKFIVGNVDNSNDVQRNGQGTAIIGDHRNDENMVVSSLQSMMLHFHNRVVDYLAQQGTASSQLFSEAQRLVRWHYQWVVLNDYLPRICGTGAVNAARANRTLYTVNQAKDIFIPLEFSAAAYRFGHSQVRERYHHNNTFRNAPLTQLFFDIPPGQLSRSVTEIWQIDWRQFAEVDPAVTPQSSRLINSRLNQHLLDIPFLRPTGTSSLAQRNLLRGSTLGLVSGQVAARAANVDVLTAAQLNQGDDNNTLDQLGLLEQTPLWFYLLKEAEVQNGGRHLGQLGGKIVAETLVGLLQLDPDSFLSVEPDWVPTLPAQTENDFALADMIKFSGMPNSGV